MRKNTIEELISKVSLMQNKIFRLCFNFQLRNFVIRELHDQKMDYIITEKINQILQQNYKN